MAIDADALQRFERTGFLVVEDVLTESELGALQAEYSALVDRVGERLARRGALAGWDAGAPFDERYLRVLGAEPGTYAALDISLPLTRRLRAHEVAHTGPAVFAMLTSPRLLDVVECIVGPEIYANPVQHVRIKPPAAVVPGTVGADSNVTVTHWHQDEAVITEDAINSGILTVWVAITDATPQNGCLVCVPGSHRGPHGVIAHCPGKVHVSEIYVPGALARDAEAVSVPVPVRRGGIVLLHQRTLHASLPNRSCGLRWSFDLRYQITGRPTGRACFPGFVARSRRAPHAARIDAARWAELWREARARIVSGEVEPVFNARWAGLAEHALCA